MTGIPDFAQPLGYGCWQTQERCDLLPAVQQDGFFLLFWRFRSLVQIEDGPGKTPFHVGTLFQAPLHLVDDTFQSLRQSFCGLVEFNKTASLKFNVGSFQIIRQSLAKLICGTNTFSG
jgi:hypothetical protein